MTRVDEHGIPCIVQSMWLNSSKRTYAVIKAKLFDGTVFTIRSAGFKFLLQRGYRPNNPVLDEIYRALEIEFIGKYLKRRVSRIKTGKIIEMVADRDYYAGETVYAPKDLS